MFGCIIMQRQSYGMRTKLRVREIWKKNDENTYQEINIFQVICSVFSFKLPKWMGDNYVWCLNYFDRQTCSWSSTSASSTDDIIVNDTITLMSLCTLCSAGWIIVSCLHCWSNNDFLHVWLASHITIITAITHQIV